jgi:hypothetical protein
LETLNWPHLVIWQGRIHNTTPHLQHRCINSYNSHQAKAQLKLD